MATSYTPPRQLKQSLDRFRSDPRVVLTVICISEGIQLDEATMKALPKLVNISTSTMRSELIVLKRGGAVESQFLSTFKFKAAPNCTAEIYCLLSNGYLLGQEPVTEVNAQKIQSLQASLALSLKLFYARILLEICTRRSEPATPPYTVKTASEWVASRPLSTSVKPNSKAIPLKKQKQKHGIPMGRSNQLRLGITLTDSRRLLRSFALEDELRRVIQVAQAEEGSAGNDTNRRSITLRQVHPPRVYSETDMNSTLADLGIKANTMMVVESQGSALARAEQGPVGFVGFLMAWFMSVIYWIKATFSGR